MRADKFDMASSIPSFYSTFRRIAKRKKKVSKAVTSNRLVSTFKWSLRVSGAIISHRTDFDFPTELREFDGAQRREVRGAVISILHCS